MIHDNDTILTSELLQEFFINSIIKVKKTSYRSPWQNGICERVIGILRAELLNHVIPINEKHLKYLLKEYFNKYYGSGAKNMTNPTESLKTQTPP